MKRKRSQSLDTFPVVVNTPYTPSSQKSRLRPASPHTPKTRCASLPLTKENLALLDNLSTDNTMPPNFSTHENNPAERRRLLKAHGLIYDDDAAADAHPEVIRRANEILNVKHPFDMQPASVAKLKKTIKELAVMPENTSFNKIWPLVFKDKRHVQKDDDWEEKEFEEDGLFVHEDVRFKTGTYTALDFSSHPNKAAASHMPRIKDPKPDRSYGLKESEFTEDELNTLGQCEPYDSVQTGLFLGFAAVEFKGPADGIAEAEDQAQRSGSTMSEATRQFYHWGGMRDLNAPGAVVEAMVFSVAMNVQGARMFVNWPLVRPGKSMQYHMTFLYSYDFKKEPDMISLRRHWNCVMDWGLLQRKHQIKSMMPVIGRVRGQELKDRKDAIAKQEEEFKESRKRMKMSDQGSSTQGSSRG
ncbi:MAG: hypothetical protein Q9218_004343 [Villophora microphyllina]